jgi:hypothetical protein
MTGVSSQEIEVPTPWDEAPHLAHPSGRIQLEGVGVNANSPFSGVGFRFALHDLLDPSTGYPSGAQIEFLNTRARYLWASSQLSLEELTFFRVTSLSPFSSFNRDLSFRVQLGIEKYLDGNCNGCVGGGFEVGPGVSVEPFGQAFNFFSFLNAKLNYAPDFFYSPVRIGLGPSIGVLASFDSQTKVLLTGGYTYYAFSKFPSSFYGQLNLRRAIGTRYGIDMRASQVDVYLETAGSLMWYF